LDFDFQEQRRRFQQNLIDFLNVHLTLGFTFCRSAQLEMESEVGRKDGGEYALFIENAPIALESVRKFEGQIADPELWIKIHARADQLEKLIDTL
jgi:hypothetical protein